VKISNPNLKIIHSGADFLFRYLTKLNPYIIILNSCLEIMKVKGKIHTASGEPEHG